MSATLARFVRDADHEVRVEREHGRIVVAVWARFNGAMRRSDRNYVALRVGELRGVADAISQALDI